MKTVHLAIIILFSFCATGAGCEKGSEHNNATMVNPPFIPLDEMAVMDSLMQQIGDACVLMLGTATHGTHEFYQWRAAISQRLIAEKGFGFIAVKRYCFATIGHTAKQ